METDEIIAFWSRYCERKHLDEDLRLQGIKAIGLDPEYWADQEMARLYTIVWENRRRDG